MKSFVSFAACVLLAGCSSWVGHSDRFAYVVPLYRVEIVQGNVVTKEQASLVKPGMSRDQVRAVLGSPLLTDPFHADRWDYVFTIRRQGADSQMRKLVARFEGDTLKSFDVPADLPTENEFVASINTFRPKGDAPKLALTEAEKAALPKPVRPAPAAQEATGPTRSFPPLERE
ncbi:outer membrane protein assembly factor BamE [Inhella crocodyli]|jgi:outer membrane protein assembly factor BamE|uniref:Outer membrane protein assembly factor BamE n=1 Tax=Inhella crocodyli TaxID=2499851 RepID=A0A3S2V5D8_9BURK|nr:outer membrane protein assembly factor BamE [Inhella crocodyli]RVT88861.1 outer membrane protein assembly factor BamE [Inhella crocodyli]